MKIASISTYHIEIPFETGAPTQALNAHTWRKMAILFVKVETDTGLVGWGEAFGHASAVGTKAFVDTLVAPQFIGRDPTEIASLMGEIGQRIHHYGRNGPVIYGLSGIDLALWDLAGKRAKLPVASLLGGAKRTEFPAYASLLRYTEPDVVAEMSARAVAEGYRYVKLHEIEVEPVEAARRAIGPDIGLMLDTNCPWTVAEAVEKAKALKPSNLYWLEEPVWPPEDHEGLAQVRATGTIVAAGENATGFHDFRHMFEAKAVDVAQPSVTRVGGITEARRIYALAEAYGVRIVPHCAYFGPGYLASLHLHAALAPDAPFERLYLKLEASPFGLWLDIHKGVAKLPTGPGLGCDPDMKVIERYLVQPVTVTK
jgi:L-alanine-DL-glutamate epimerase-like enolase superfamily enzyme